MTTSHAPSTTSMTTTEGALQLWREIVRGLRAADYVQSVPEYLKLSRVLSQVRVTELLQGKAEAEHWTELRKLAAEALQSLDTLAEAARVLAQIPSDIRESQPSVPALPPNLPVFAGQLAVSGLDPEAAPPVERVPEPLRTKVARNRQPRRKTCVEA
jgi:hypothetical protein